MKPNTWSNDLGIRDHRIAADDERAESGSLDRLRDLEAVRAALAAGRKLSPKLKKYVCDGIAAFLAEPSKGLDRCLQLNVGRGQHAFETRQALQRKNVLIINIADEVGGTFSRCATGTAQVISGERAAPTPKAADYVMEFRKEYADQTPSPGAVYTRLRSRGS